MTRILTPTLIALTLAIAPSFSQSAIAQTAGGTGGGMNSNARSMSGPNINVDNGINADGTPKQQSPGVSMTNGPNGASSQMLINGDGQPTQSTPPANSGLPPAPTSASPSSVNGTAQ